MAKIDIVMPQMGESITNGTITKWHKRPGDQVKLDEILFEISTDKVESEIPSPVEGRLEEILFPEGATVDVGIKVATIQDDLSAPVASTSTQTQTPLPAPAVTEQPKAVAAPNSNTVANEGSASRRFYTPLVRAMAAKQGVTESELANIHGSGAGGRVNKSDLEKYLSSRGRPQASSTESPAAVRLEVQASTPSGRVEVIPMDNMRKAIAKNMVESKLTAPHVNSMSEVDLSHLVKFREGFKKEFQRQEGFNLTYTPFIMWAIIQALKEYPLVNASIEGDNIVVKKDINLGCAVAVPGNGLVVPVVKNADTLNMTGLCRAVNALAEKARAKKLTLENLQGGTFTFTNVGSFGTLMATPIILRPQVGIYASGVIQKRVVVLEDDVIAIRSMMYGTHTYDHRLVDGELGGKFLEAVHRNLRSMDPKSLF